MSRHHVNKGRSAKQFRGNMRRTKGANVAPPRSVAGGVCKWRVIRR